MISVPMQYSNLIEIDWKIDSVYVMIDRKKTKIYSYLNGDLGNQ